MKIEQAEMEQAVHTLLDKHAAWLEQQPEWTMFIGGADRLTRRRMAKLLAKMFTTIPHRVIEPQLDANGKELPYVNRGMRRRLIREMARAEKAWWKE
jgi:hypothetical protein